MTRVIESPRELAEACEEARLASKRVGVVPTMGALHEGHLALIDEARRQGADFIVVTIFVNPLQFGEGEDFAQYPRTLEHDLTRCELRRVDVAFIPGDERMVPPGFQTHVEVERLTQALEGAHRPGHFRGVTTVVAKILGLTLPCVAVFGRKDYQQWKVIERMVEDLQMRASIVAHPTVREADGLALSSRNRYLSPEQRNRALGIARGLRRASQVYTAGERDARTLRALVLQPIEESFDDIDYVEVVDPETLSELEGQVDRALVVVAATLGSTRLIDNLCLGEDPEP